MNKKELLLKAKKCGIKGIYRMNKDQLASAIYVHECATWFNDIAGNKITIHDNSDVEIEVLDISAN
jgi:hypothetical protein